MDESSSTTPGKSLQPDKIAALDIQRFNDATVMSAVSDVETLCTSLSGKVWQKLQIAEAILDDATRRADAEVAKPPRTDAEPARPPSAAAMLDAAS